MLPRDRFILGACAGFATATALLLSRTGPHGPVAHRPPHPWQVAYVGGVPSASAQSDPRPATADGAVTSALPIDYGTRFTRWGMPCEQPYGPVEDVRGSWVLAAHGDAGKAWHNIAMWPDLIVCP